MARYLYILSLERSGSTPLAWNLGTRPGVIALGEVERTLALLARPVEMPRACTCGADAADCPVWGHVARRRGELGALSPLERYRLLDDALSQAGFGDALFVDASKSLEDYRLLRAVAAPNVAGVHLVKDVRSYLDSTLGRMATMDRERLWAEQIAARPLRARLMRAMPQSLVYLLRWMRRNRAMARALEEDGAPWMRIGYEGLCSGGDAALDRMVAVAGRASGSSGQHILFGSFGYLDGAGDKSLRHDVRWKRSSRRLLLELAALAAALPNRRLQREAVHRGASPARSMTT